MSAVESRVKHRGLNRRARLSRWAEIMRLVAEVEDAIQEARTDDVIDSPNAYSLIGSVDCLRTELLTAMPR